jgi:hypothetical protein
MPFFWIFCAFLLSIPREAAAFQNYSYLFHGNRIRMLVEKLPEGILANDICLKKGKGCRGLQVFHGPTTISRLSHALPGNAAGAYCELLKGSQLFAQAEGESANTLFCVFHDLSAIDARALYQAHFERERKAQP